MSRGGAGLLLAVAAGTVLLGGCRAGAAAPVVSPAAPAVTADLGGVEATLDRLEREIDSDGAR